MDVKTIFLIGKLGKKIYMEQPEVVLSLDNNLKSVNWLNLCMD